MEKLRKSDSKELLEIFGIHVPLLYGEGEKALRGLQLEILQNIRMTQYFRGIQAISFAIHGMSWLGLRTSSRTALTWNHYIRFNMIHQCSILLK